MNASAPESEASAHEPAPPTLGDVVSQSGHRLDDALADFDGMASDAQQWRFDARTTDRATVTRSTALWTLRELDPRTGAALESAGLQSDAWAEGIGLNVFSPKWAAPAGLDDLFRDDLVAYLGTLPRGSRVVAADVVLALLEAATSDVGAWPSRLRRLQVDVPAAMQAVGHVLSETTAVGFSQSVRDSVVKLGGEGTIVSAGDLASAIQRLHPDYAEQAFGSVALGAAGGEPATVQVWLDRARALYDGRVVAASPHQVIDGELLVLALAELDPHLAMALRANDVLANWRASTVPLPRPAYSTGTRVSHDGPADIDLLGRQYLARTLVNLLEAAATTSSDALLVHIDGPWGSGKSTLLDYVRTELGDRYLVVRVNAWREQRVGVQWWTLHRALRSAIAAEARPRLRSRWRSRWQGLVDLVLTRLVVVVIAALVGAAVIVGAVLLRWNDLKDATEVLGSLTTAAALGVGGLLAAYRFLLPGSRRSARSFEGASANPMREVRELFARTLRRADKPVVFFIDDLDRCEDDYLVTFLEVVQTLVRDALDPGEDLPSSEGHKREGAPGPYAFVAADGQWMRACYENKYGDAHRSDIAGKPMGYLFLEKIFQMHVRLPALGDEVKQAFYESLLLARPDDAVSERERQVIDRVRADIRAAASSQGVSDASRAARQVTDVRERIKLLGEASVRLSDVAIFKETTHELAPFGRFLEPNPRTIRLFVNSVGTLQALRTLEGVAFETPILALWNVVESRWPELADHLRRHPGDIDPKAATDPVIAALLARADVRAVIVDSGWGALSAQDVRNCTGVGHRTVA